MWGEFFTMTQWECSSIQCLCWITVSLKNPLLGNYFPLNKHVFNLPILISIYPKCIKSGSVQLLFSSLHLGCFFYFLSASLSPKIVESRECGRVESQLADWIVFCSISDCIKQPRLWTYKEVMDASSFLLDRSELTSAEGRKGKKRSKRLIYWPGW